MSDNNKNITHYSASDIQRYLRGELSAPEMHDLEKAALDDPFLADALQGMATDQSIRGEMAFQQDLEELKKRLDDRVTPKTSSKPAFLLLFRSWQQAAAILILLVGMGTITWYVLAPHNGSSAEVRSVATESHTNPAASVPQAAPTPQSAPTGPAEGSSTAAAPTTTLPKPNTTTTEKDKETEAKAQASVVARNDASAKFKLADRALADRPQPAVSDEPAKDSTAFAPAPALGSLSFERRTDTPKFATTFGFHQNDSLALQAVTLNKSLFKTDRRSNQVFTGLVTDQDNNPISGAYITLKGRDHFSTVTDNSGAFRMKLPQKDSLLNLTVAYVGYQDASIVVDPYNNLSGNIIQLQRQTNSLSEVVVTGMRASKKKSVILNRNATSEFSDLDTTMRNSQDAIPVIGWEAYHRYLDSNKHSITLDPTLQGAEVISFKVNKKGELSAFKVERSLSPSHDSLAIRLIQQGPAWKPVNRKKARASITVTF